MSFRIHHNTSLCLGGALSALVALASCKGVEVSEPEPLFCKHGPYANYKTWIKTPSADRSLVADQNAIVIRVSQDSFYLYKSQAKGACEADLRTWDEVTQENGLALAAFLSEKEFCEVKAVNPAYLGLDPQAGQPWPTDPFQKTWYFGLKNPHFIRNDSIRQPPNRPDSPPTVKSAEVSVFSTDACDTIEAVVRLIEEKQD